MISKKVPKKTGVADNFDRLARYIAAADQPGEKLRDFWMGNCDAGDGIDQLDLGIIEIEAARQLKPDVKDKTYHFILSFRESDETKLDGAAMREIAARFVDVMGFDGHQYVAGAHQNTENFHIHVAVNRVHPKTLKVHNPYMDFRARDKLAREIEKAYGLAVDPGKSEALSLRGISADAQDFERHTWQQSFHRFMQDKKPDILGAVERAKGWPDLHKELAGWNVGIKPRGNGLVFYELDGKGAMKASAVVREASKKALEARFGPYQTPEQGRGPGRAAGTGEGRYQRPPLLPRHPNTGPLWNRYIGARKQPWTKSTILGRAVSNWKLWLATEAYEDPLAMVLMIAHMEALRTVFGDPNKPKRFPKTAAPALSALAGKREWIQLPKSAAVDLATSAGGSMIDDAGNQVAAVRDDNADLVGLLVINKDGKTLALGPDDKIKAAMKTASKSARKGRENGPQIG